MLSDQELVDIWYRNEAYEINIIRNLQLTDDGLQELAELLKKRDKRNHEIHD